MPLNQTDEPNFERRLLLAFALSVILFLIVLPWLSPSSKMPPPSQAEKQPAAAPAVKANPATAPSTNAAPPTAATVPQTKPPTAKVKLTPAPATPAIAASAEQTVTVNTPVYHIELSNRGAVATSWILTQYKDDAGKPLNVVDPNFSKNFGYPLAFWVPDAAMRKQLDDALYQVRQSSAPDGSQTVDFTWSDGTLSAEKHIRLQRGYVADIQSSVTRDGQAVPAALAWQGAFGDRAVPGDFNTEQYFQQESSSVETQAVKKVTSGATHQGLYQFAGVEDQYFAMAFLPNYPPDSQPALTITTLKNQYQPRLINASGDITSNTQVSTIGLAVSDGDSNNTRLFVGPKKIDLLKQVDAALRGLVDFGWFSFIAEPLFLWMNWTYVHWIHNYGWAILFLTFVITMATFPLKMKSQKSMAKMQAIQPQINALNAKMKKYPMRDPRRQEIQSEVMKVMSENGANPVGGCLPMLIQLPLIYAFWRVLEYAIELRHAPWFGYIHDLSAKDPYFLLPLLVVVTQFFSMSLMPTMAGQDPRQAKMMKWMMPILMGWFFFYLPSGVNLYYLGYNVISTGQQWVANKTYNDKALAEVAARSRAKTGGKPLGKSNAKPEPDGGSGKKVIEGKVVGKK